MDYNPPKPQKSILDFLEEKNVSIDSRLNVLEKEIWNKVYLPIFRQKEKLGKNLEFKDFRLLVEKYGFLKRYKWNNTLLDDEEIFKLYKAYQKSDLSKEKVEDLIYKTYENKFDSKLKSKQFEDKKIDIVDTLLEVDPSKKDLNQRLQVFRQKFLDEVFLLYRLIFQDN